MFVVELDVGDARHALVAQHGKGGIRDGGIGRHADVDEDLPRLLRIEIDGIDLAHFQAPVAHGGLRIQARHGQGGGEQVGHPLHAVAVEPDTEQDGGHQQGKCKKSRHQGM